MTHAGMTPKSCLMSINNKSFLISGMQYILSSTTKRMFRPLFALTLVGIIYGMDMERPRRSNWAISWMHLAFKIPKSAYISGVKKTLVMASIIQPLLRRLQEVAGRRQRPWVEIHWLNRDHIAGDWPIAYKSVASTQGRVEDAFVARIAPLRQSCRTLVIESFVILVEEISSWLEFANEMGTVQRQIYSSNVTTSLWTSILRKWEGSSRRPLAYISNETFSWLANVSTITCWSIVVMLSIQTICPHGKAR